MKAKQGDVVKVHYTGTFDSGEVFDTSRENEPLQFTIGNGDLIPGFEQAVIGMTVKEIRKVVIPPEEAYGEYAEEMIVTVERAEMPDDLDPEVDLTLEFVDEDENSQLMRIVEFDDDTITLDGNHPLAGETLNFEIELVEIC